MNCCISKFMSLFMARFRENDGAKEYGVIPPYVWQDSVKTLKYSVRNLQFKINGDAENRTE